jgi:hypothetical protein
MTGLVFETEASGQAIVSHDEELEHGPERHQDIRNDEHSDGRSSLSGLKASVDKEWAKKVDGSRHDLRRRV